MLYARASTKDKQHPELQIEELRAVAVQRGWTVVGEFIEHESGSKIDRPKFNAALGIVRAGGADVFAAVELSRFGRSLSHLVDVAAELSAHGADLVCTRQPIDTTTPAGRLLFHILAAMAQFEKELIRERVTAGVRHARAKRGGAWGRGRQPIPPEALKLAHHLRTDQAMSWAEVCGELARAGWTQPAKASGKKQHPPRPWPTGTVRDALARVGIPNL